MVNTIAGHKNYLRDTTNYVRDMRHYAKKIVLMNGTENRINSIKHRRTELQVYILQIKHTAQKTFKWYLKKFSDCELLKGVRVI